MHFSEFSGWQSQVQEAKLSRVVVQVQVAGRRLVLSEMRDD